jgi:hypothetical protein
MVYTRYIPPLEYAETKLKRQYRHLIKQEIIIFRRKEKTPPKPKE